ncbi:hypothetical protein [Paenibacillus spongiae]|uniref:Uncharacterized protein n=1 Tax=Paenibacillus spongiae TaxID=2909671 RepID=A0ABY5S8P5_9BACL|nr:hypothetical protein [Paenibacillus spongiae]UVI30094.1 hypothetical protein L1F29_32765 [Paenibacillus spongiae]
MNYILGYFFDEELYTGGISSIFIFMLIIGMILQQQTFPFAIGLSVRRTDYYWGTVAVSGIVIGVTSLLLMLLSAVEGELLEGWGVGLHFFYLPHFSDGPILLRVWISFALMLHLFHLGFGIASVHRRYGKLGMLVLSLSVFLASSIAGFLLTYYRWWDDLFEMLIGLSAAELASWSFPITVLYAIASYALLRRSTV